MELNRWSYMEPAFSGRSMTRMLPIPAAQDFSEVINLAELYPAKLRELKELWWSEAEKYGSLPLK